MLLAAGRATPSDEKRWARTLLSDAVVALAGREDRPAVDERLVEGDAAHALLDAARDAALLVVGARRNGVIHGTLFGSVSQRCAIHARCPVVVVPRE
jgi:nucleotide-binding universal stress UspA family protein